MPITLAKIWIKLKQNFCTPGWEAYFHGYVYSHKLEKYQPHWTLFFAMTALEAIPIKSGSALLVWISIRNTAFFKP